MKKFKKIKLSPLYRARRINVPQAKLLAIYQCRYLELTSRRVLLNEILETVWFL